MLFYSYLSLQQVPSTPNSTRLLSRILYNDHKKMSSTTTSFPNTLDGIKAFCKGRKPLDLVRSFSTAPIPGAPEKWDDTLGVCLDLVWYNQPSNNPTEVINESGLVVFTMKKTL
jgi:hypothetical protein